MGKAARAMKRRAQLAAKRSERKAQRKLRRKQPITRRRVMAARIPLGVGSRLAPGSVVIGPDGQRQPMAAAEPAPDPAKTCGS